MKEDASEASKRGVQGGRREGGRSEVALSLSLSGDDNRNLLSCVVSGFIFMFTF